MSYDVISIAILHHDTATAAQMQKLLERLFTGASIRFETDGAEFRKSLELNQPSILLCDMHCGGRGGLALCAEIKESALLNDIYIIMLVDGAVSDERVEALSRGADDFLPMPATPDELLAKVQAGARIVRLHDQVNTERKRLRRLTEQMNKDLLELLEVAVNMIHCRIPDSQQTQERVIQASVWIARAFEDLGEAEIEDTRVAASLCMLGKLVLPDNLINQPVVLEGKATTELMRQVPIYAARMLEPSKRLENAANIIKHIYENYDGSGFPDRLKLYEIPIQSRIIRVVLDYVNYRDVLKLDPLDALDAVKRQDNHVFDPRFTQLLDEYLWTISTETMAKNVRALKIYELEDGMRIARDIVTNSGMKLLSAGAVCSSKNIERIINHASSDPILGAVYVFKD